MVYNPVTDFLGLWRSGGGQVSKLEMPGLDYMVQALARAGLITLSVSATAPVANQSITAWLQTAVPSYSAEGVLHLWDPAAAAYAAASPALLLRMLEACAGQNGASWFTVTGGAPANIVGNNGDFAIRTDEPGGIYGPKTAGAWPVSPIPGTTDIIGSTQLDQTFGGAEGTLIVRGPAVWEGLPVGADGQLLYAIGALPAWIGLSPLIDSLFGSVQGSFLYRGATDWEVLAPGAASQILITNGPGADPQWGPRTAEFPSGTVMLFQQTAAPPGWTKNVTFNDYALRVTSGVVGSVAGSAFSSVFAQTAVGSTTLDVTQIPPHHHTYQYYSGSVHQDGTQSFTVQTALASNVTGDTGGGLSHTHSVNLTLSYVDVIIATKN